MPNWCDCKLRVTGPEEDLIRFAEALNAGRDENGHIHILATLYPLPEELEAIFVNPTEVDGKEGDHRPDPTASLPGHLWIDAKVAELESKYGATSRFEWQLRHWGTKWGDCYSTMNGAVGEPLLFEYETPWGPGLPGFLKISEDWDSLHFKLEHYEPLNGVGGTIEFGRGTVWISAFHAEDRPPCGDDVPGDHSGSTEATV